MLTGPPPAQGPHVSSPSALPPGTRLGEFELLRVLGIGGFGIVYLALDHDLEREVAVKEYMPAALAGRTETLHVSLRSQSDAETFALGLRSFVNEARLLARFDHPSLLKVHRYWEANGTAYMAMPVLRGRTVKEVRQQMAAPPDEAWLRALLDPLLGAIERLHAEGVYHRDIAPDNIQIEPDGRPVLLDFGAARRVIGDKSQTLTAILKPAYAPIEQYAEAGSVRQGPWTDLYALGATLHYLLLLRPPPPATARAVHDDAQPLATMQLPGCSTAFLQAIDWMLAPRPADRPQSVAALREVLAGRVAPPQRRAVSEPPPGPWERTTALPPAAAARAAEPDTSTRVVPQSQPPARAAMPPPGPAPGGPTTAPRPTAPPVTPAPPQPAMSASVPVPPARSRLVPALLGLVVVAVIGAVAFWPRPSEAPAQAVGAGPGAGQAAAPGSPAPAAVVEPPAKPPPALAAAPTVTAPTAPAVPAVNTATPSSPPAVPAVPPPATPQAAAPAVRDSVVGSPPAAAAAPTPAAVVAAPPPRADPGAPSTRVVTTPAPARAAPAAPVRAAAADPAARPAATPRPPAPAAAPVEAPRPREPARAATEPPAYGTTPPTAPGYGTSPAVTAPPAAATPPAAEPAPVAAGPEARCAGRNPFSYFACMERECWRAEFQQHADCLAWRKEARRR